MANRWVALAIVFVTRTSIGYQFQSVASVGPLLVSELGLTWAQLGLLIGLYMLPGAFFALPSGVVSQRLGERRTVVGSLALMVVGGLVTAASPGFAVAAAGRLLGGIGAVLMNILLAKMVADWFAEREMSTAMAVMLTSWPVGLGVAAATLGGLATRSSWRMAIVATALAAALGLVLIAFAYRDPSRTARGAAGAPRGARGARGRARGERGPRVGLLQREPRRCRRVRPRDADGPRPPARRRRLRREPGDLGDDPLGAPRRAPHRPPPPAEPEHRRRQPRRGARHDAAARPRSSPAGILPARPRDRSVAGRGDGARAQGGRAPAAGDRPRRLLRGVLRRDGGDAARGGCRA